MKKRQWMHAAAAVSAAALWGSTSPALAAQAAGASAAPAVQQEQQVAVDLAFDASAYKEQTLSIEGKKVKFRAYENIVYVRHPAAAAAQSMSIYIPSSYFEKGGEVNGYTAKTAPIFLPNGVGGYMPGSIAAPSADDERSGGANASLVALSRGCVVAAPAIRGRTTTDEAGAYVGKAPALIVDYKAAVRYLRYNKDRLPAQAIRRKSSPTVRARAARSPRCSGRRATVRTMRRTLRRLERRRSAMISSLRWTTVPSRISIMPTWRMSGSSPA